MCNFSFWVPWTQILPPLCFFFSDCYCAALVALLSVVPHDTTSFPDSRLPCCTRQISCHIAKLNDFLAFLPCTCSLLLDAAEAPSARSSDRLVLTGHGETETMVDMTHPSFHLFLSINRRDSCRYLTRTSASPKFRMRLSIAVIREENPKA